MRGPNSPLISLGQDKCVESCCHAIQPAGGLGPHVMAQVLVSACVAWTCFASLSVFPNSLAYFNELAGGPNRGHFHLLSSNIDWGQDLIVLRDLMRECRDGRQLYLAYYGSCDPAIVGIQYLPATFTHERENSAHDKTDASGESKVKRVVDELPEGIYAISVNYLRGLSRHLKGQGVSRTIVHPHAYDGFLSKQRTGNAGYSIYIYEVNR